jgi:hypothetical protein
MNENHYNFFEINAEDGALQTKTFRRLQNYESVSITFSWSGLNVTGGTIKLQEGINDKWVDIPCHVKTMDVIADTDAFQHINFGNKDVRLVVNFGTGECEDIDQDLDEDCEEIVATEGIIYGDLVAKCR